MPCSGQKRGCLMINSERAPSRSRPAHVEDYVSRTFTVRPSTRGAPCIHGGAAQLPRAIVIWHAASFNKLLTHWQLVGMATQRDSLSLPPISPRPSPRASGRTRQCAGAALQNLLFPSAQPEASQPQAAQSQPGGAPWPWALLSPRGAQASRTPDRRPAATGRATHGRITARQHARAEARRLQPASLTCRGAAGLRPVCAGGEPRLEAGDHSWRGWGARDAHRVRRAQTQRRWMGQNATLDGVSTRPGFSLVFQGLAMAQCCTRNPAPAPGL